MWADCIQRTPWPVYLQWSSSRCGSWPTMHCKSDELSLGYIRDSFLSDAETWVQIDGRERRHGAYRCTHFDALLCTVNETRGGRRPVTSKTWPEPAAETIIVITYMWHCRWHCFTVSCGYLQFRLLYGEMWLSAVHNALRWVVVICSSYCFTVRCGYLQFIMLYGELWLSAVHNASRWIVVICSSYCFTVNCGYLQFILLHSELWLSAVHTASRWIVVICSS